MLLLSSFVAAYVALSGWFVWTALRNLAAVVIGRDDAVWAAVGGGAAAYLAVFMLKALFFVKHSYEINDIEITPQQEPRLFAFLNRLADEAKAPRAHRVFLSPLVNAAVFYDLSILNLILPSKKNLEIGLGLVNVLNMGEFKAVLAHEFGHFAQRSMAVGRWVYIAQQIAGHIITTRDALDSFLSRLSRFDFRVAWIGWLLSLIVWSIRSVMVTFFHLVILAQRALSREMEFQADLVSVSLTGSDALIHALHRLQVADDAWDRTLHFGFVEVQKARPVRDLFAVQHRIIHHMRTILSKPEYGAPPAMPQQQPDRHRIFKLELAQAPRMWSTHPSNTDREANAKRTYIPADIDDGSVWELFQDAGAIKERMSQHIFKAGADAPPAAPVDESLKRLDERYERSYLQPRYRGVYLGRSVVRHATNPGELYVEQPANEDLPAALDSLYPESIADRLERLRELHDELNALEALRLGVASAPGGVMQHRGRQLRRADLPGVISQLRGEVRATAQTVQEHDRRCRSIHMEAARQVGMGWDEYLRGLAGVLHYADHTEADLRDVQGLFANVYAVVTADRNVSATELDRLVGTANRVFVVLKAVYAQAGAVSLDSALLRELGTESWAQMLGEFKLIKASKENIGDWLGVIDSWINATAAALESLQLAALNQLLVTEGEVAGFLRQGVQPPEAQPPQAQPPEAPPASVIPKDYPVLPPGKERERQTSLDLWSRFQIADGLAPTLARLAVAGAIITVVLLLGGSTAQPSLMVYNGLDTTVNVALGPSRITLNPFTSGVLDTPGGGRHMITTTAVTREPACRKQ